MKKVLFILATFSLLAACGGVSVPESNSGKLNVVATTSIVADIVRQVGGGLIDVEILLPEGTDPHSFDPSPQDIAMVADADIIFANGAGLEAFIEHLLESAGAEERVVEVSKGVELLTHPEDSHTEDEGDHADHEEGEDGHHDEHEEDEDGHHDDHEDHAHDKGDPHTWTDPNNVMIWVQNIELALSEADSSNGQKYAESAASYISELEEIDAWIREEIMKIPVEKRKIVTDHRLLGYYVEEYGLEQVGAIVEGYSSLAEPSAQELAEIEDAISALGVQAIFVGNTVNANLAEQISEDTGIKLVYFYTGSLSEAGGEAESYLDYLRYNTNAFVNALK